MKNKKIIILLSILIGTALIAISWGIFLMNRDANDKKNINNIEEEKLSEEEDANIYQKILEKITFFETYLSNVYPIENLSKLSEKEKTLFLLKISCNYHNKTITEEHLQEKANEYFKKFSLYQGDLKDNNGNVLYNYENGQYSFVSDDVSNRMAAGYEISSKGTKKLWIIKRKLYYSDFVLDDVNFTYTINFYAKVNDKEPLLTRTSNINSGSLDKEEYQKIKSKLSTVTYEFVNENNNYILNSIKLS